MKLLDRFKLATKAFNSTYEDSNKLYKALFSYFNTMLYILPDDFISYVTKGYQGNPDIYSIVSMISRKAASVPMYLYEITDDQKIKKYKVKSRNLDVKNLILKEQTLKEVEGTDLNKLLENPNEMQGQQQFAEAWFSFLLITGNTFIYELKPEFGLLKGKPTKVYPMPSQYVQIIGGGAFMPIKEYKMMIGNQGVTFPADEIYHTKLFNPCYSYSGDELYGQSPIKAALSTLGSSNEAVNAKYKAFQNGGVAGLLSNKDPNIMLSVEQMAQIASIVKEKIVGSNNARNITATAAAVDYTQIGLSPVDLAVIDSLGYDRDTFCRIYGIDPILLSVDSASYNNKITASKKMVSDVLVPYLNLYRDFWNSIAEQYNKDGKKYYIDYDISVLPEMQDDLATLVKTLLEAYWITPNEKRKATNYDTSKDPLMDKFYIPSNLVPIDEISLNLDSTLKNFDYPNDK